MTGLTELLPPLTENEALVESNRCLYCYDAPCAHACPTHIDIPRFIKKIATGNLTGSARTIFEANLLGATCARVCPVQELCEGACVLGPEHKPIAIGRLQRHAMDFAYRTGSGLPRQGNASGGRIAVVGAGPAGLSCAGELARLGHSVTLFEKRELAGGLSTFGIIALREPVDIALAEVGMITRLGVELRTGVELGSDFAVHDLLRDFEAVFLSVGPLVEAGAPPVVLCSAEARPVLKDLTRADLPRLVVLSQREIPRDAPVESFGVVVEEDAPVVSSVATAAAAAGVD